MDDSCGHASSSAAAAHHPRIHLYAEHLQNIRTLSIQASLATFSNTETKATLSADGSQLSLSHEGETATIQLPITVPGGHNDATLVIPSAPSKELTFRVSLEEKPGSNLLGERPAGGETIVPWMSSHLSASAEISCASCRSVLIPRGTVTQWKDLPSEGWAEMMDFWHCHKPDVPHDHHHHDVHGANGSAGRGIGANSRLAVERGVGLVGPLELLFAKEDTRGIKVGCKTFPTFLFSHPVSYILALSCCRIAFLRKRKGEKKRKLRLGASKNRPFQAARLTFKERRRDTGSLDQRTIFRSQACVNLAPAMVGCAS